MTFLGVSGAMVTRVGVRAVNNALARATVYRQVCALLSALVVRSSSSTTLLSSTPVFKFMRADGDNAVMHRVLWFLLTEVVES